MGSTGRSSLALEVEVMHRLQISELEAPEEKWDCEYCENAARVKGVWYILV
jgi:hypothetical protein